MTTIQDAWRQGQMQLHDSPSPSLDARLLLEYVLQQDHAYLLAHGDHLLTAEQMSHYQGLIQKAAEHTPIPYLTGRAPFFGMDFKVSPSVLIPRPETEQLVEEAIRWSRTRDQLRLIDVGTGSGCIAITLAVHMPRSEIVATDISAAALAVAKENSFQLGAGRVTFVQADLLEPFNDGFDMILANLPYIAGHEWLGLADGVKFFEPPLALHGGSDGLELIRRLLPQATERLRTGGLAILEIGWQQGEQALNLARAAFRNAEVNIVQDFAGHDRMLLIRN